MRSGIEVIQSVDYLNSLAYQIERGKTEASSEEREAIARLNGAIAKMTGDNWRKKKK